MGINIYMIFVLLIKPLNHTAKYMITLHIPKLLLKSFLLFFFTIYKNEWKERKF